MKQINILSLSAGGKKVGRQVVNGDEQEYKEN
jgi:hypothetical protein